MNEINEDKMRQIECETYLDNAICEKSQEDRIKELEEAVEWLAIDLVSLFDSQFGPFSSGKSMFDRVFDNMPNVKILDSIPNLKATLMEMSK